MPFSLTSYCLGVGTVVGALALGFGGGVMLTNTAMKEGATGPTRVERVARAEPEAAAPRPQVADAQATNPKENTAPAPTIEPPAAVRSDPVPAAQPEAVKSDTRREAEVPKAPEPTKQIESAGQAEQTKQAGPIKQAEQPKPADQSEVEKTASERKIERQKRYAERKARETTSARELTSGRIRQQQVDQSEPQGQPEQPGFALGRAEPHFDLFRVLSPPPFNGSADRDN
jgi:hypothetical protein